jgi:hypothetical protein
MLEDFFESEFFLIRNSKSFSLNKKILENFIRTILSRRKVSFHNFLVKRFIIKNNIFFSHGDSSRRVTKKKPRFKFVLRKNSKKPIFRALINNRMKNISGNDKTNLIGKTFDIRLEIWWLNDYSNFKNLKKIFLDILFFKNYKKCTKISIFGRFLNKKLNKKPKNTRIRTIMNYILNFKK